MRTSIVSFIKACKHLKLFTDSVDPSWARVLAILGETLQRLEVRLYSDFEFKGETLQRLKVRLYSDLR